jgi:hypothetical protein
MQFQFNSIQFNSIQFNSIQFNSIQFNSIRFNSIQFNSIQFNSIQFNLTIQFNSRRVENTVSVTTWVKTTEIKSYHELQSTTVIHKQVLKLYEMKLPALLRTDLLKACEMNSLNTADTRKGETYECVKFVSWPTTQITSGNLSWIRDTLSQEISKNSGKDLQNDWFRLLFNL